MSQYLVGTAPEDPWKEPEEFAEAEIFGVKALTFADEVSLDRTVRA
jgi:hypothetical protein